MEQSIFTKIINGEIPCHKIYEDEQVIAFLDIQPMTEGHTLVIPKQQVDHLWDLDDELYSHLMLKVKMIAQHLRTTLGTKRVSTAIDGYAVPHAHVHLVPTNVGLEQIIAKGEYIDKPANHEELAEVAKKLKIS